MSKLKFSCPSCEQSIEGEASYGGKMIDCPTCGSKMLVPMPTTPPDLPTPVEGESEQDGATGGIYAQLESTAEQVRALPEFTQLRPGRGRGIKAFLGRAGGAIRLIFTEKELIVFSLLQWVAIGLVYLLWVLVLGWIQEVKWPVDRMGISVGSYVSFIWSLLCIGLAAFPLGILSGCMGAAHFLNRQGQKSTIARCLKIVMPHALRLWALHWADATYTCHQNLERVPKKKSERRHRRALRKALYYAWKLGTAAMMPGLVMGKGLIEASKDSVKLVKNRFVDLALLRIGYSVLCWVVGILAYLGAVYFFWATDFFTKTNGMEEGVRILHFYKLGGVPILIAVGAVLLFLRPLFLLSLCDLYAEEMEARGETIELGEAPGRGKAALVAFAVAAAIALVGGVYLKALLKRDDRGTGDPKQVEMAASAPAPPAGSAGDADSSDGKPSPEPPPDGSEFSARSTPGADPPTQEQDETER